MISMYKYCLSLNISLLWGVQHSTLDITGCQAGTASGIIDMTGAEESKGSTRALLRVDRACVSLPVQTWTLPSQRTQTEQPQPCHCGGDVKHQTAQPLHAPLLALPQTQMGVTVWKVQDRVQLRADNYCGSRRGQGRCWGNWNIC